MELQISAKLAAQCMISKYDMYLYTSSQHVNI